MQPEGVATLIWRNSNFFSFILPFLACYPVVMVFHHTLKPFYSQLIRFTSFSIIYPWWCLYFFLVMTAVSTLKVASEDSPQWTLYLRKTAHSICLLLLLNFPSAFCPRAFSAFKTGNKQKDQSIHDLFCIWREQRKWCEISFLGTKVYASQGHFNPSKINLCFSHNNHVDCSSKAEFYYLKFKQGLLFPEESKKKFAFLSPELLFLAGIWQCARRLTSIVERFTQRWAQGVNRKLSSVCPLITTGK